MYKAGDLVALLRHPGLLILDHAWLTIWYIVALYVLRRSARWMFKAYLVRARYYGIPLLPCYTKPPLNRYPHHDIEGIVLAE